MLADDLLRPDAAMLCPALSPGAEKGVAITKGFFMPDWACALLGRPPGFCRIQYEFMGRFIAYAMYQGCRIDARLVAYIYRCILTDCEPPIPGVGYITTNALLKQQQKAAAEEEGKNNNKINQANNTNTSNTNTSNSNTNTSNSIISANGPSASSSNNNDGASSTNNDMEVEDIASSAAAVNKGRDSSGEDDLFHNDWTNWSTIIDVDDNLLPGPKWTNWMEALEDLRSVDPMKAQGLHELMEEEPDDVEDIFCLDFKVEFKFMGQDLTFNLKNVSEECPEGPDTPVTGENRGEYVLLVCKWFLKASVRNSLGSFLRGFHSVLSRKCLRMLSPKLIEAMLCGQSEVTDDDIGDLRAVVVMTNHDNQENTSTLLRNFFEIFLSYDQDLRKKFLQFWCGTTRVPAAGFAALHPPMTMAIIVGSANLPQTHVCFNRIDLPNYPDKATLKTKLTTAIQLAGTAISLE